jgi:hypothetical protein
LILKSLVIFPKHTDFLRGTTFAAQGSFDSAGNFGEMGTERNGLFVADEPEKIGAAWLSSARPQASATVTTAIAPAALSNVPKSKGRVPVSALVH